MDYEFRQQVAELDLVHAGRKYFYNRAHLLAVVKRWELAATFMCPNASWSGTASVEP
jgi:hypothetical protein